MDAETELMLMADELNVSTSEYTILVKSRLLPFPEIWQVLILASLKIGCVEIVSLGIGVDKEAAFAMALKRWGEYSAGEKGIVPKAGSIEELRLKLAAAGN